MCASVTYFLTWGLTLFFLGFLIQYYNTYKIKNAVIACLLMFCIIGANELSAFFVLIVVALKLLHEIFLEKKINAGTVHFVILVLILVLVVLLAPGNTVRQLSYGNHHNIRFSLFNSFINLARVTVLILKSPPFIILLLLTIINASSLSASSTILKKITKGKLLIFILLSFFTGYFFYFMAAFSMGINPPLRVHDFIIFLLIVTMLLATLITSSLYKLILIEKESLKKLNVLVVVIFFLFIISDFHKLPGENIYIKGNICLAAYDITHQAPAYNSAMNERYNQIDKAIKTGTKNLTVPVLCHKPRSIFFVDIKADSTHWINWGYARYFNLNSIKTTP